MNNVRQLSTISMEILGYFETTMIQKQFKVILINYKENYDTTTKTIQWVLTSVQFNLVCFLSRSGSLETLGNYKDNYDTATTTTNKSIGFDLSAIQSCFLFSSGIA